MSALERPQLLLLGTSHWSNPSKDLITHEHDDMLAEVRQQQVAQVLERLTEYRPNKVLLEIEYRDQGQLDDEFVGYRRGELELTANERHQLGFRLAAKLQHERVYGVDWHDHERPIPWMEAIDFAIEQGQANLVPDMNLPENDRQSRDEEDRVRIASTSVADLLRQGNDSDQIENGHHFYANLAQVGSAGNYIGADVVLRWYERNLKIYTNIRRLIVSPDDRFLLVIGSGHLPLLRHFAVSSGAVELVDARRFL